MVNGVELPRGRYYEGVQLDHATKFEGAVINWQIKELGNYQPDQKLLDLGTGKGIVVHYLREKGIDAYGVDLRNVFLTRKRYFVNADLHQLPYPNNAFHFVTEMLTLTQIRELDLDSKTPKIVLAEMKRVLKPEGYFISMRGSVSEAEMKNLGFTDITPGSKNYNMYQQGPFQNSS